MDLTTGPIEISDSEVEPPQQYVSEWILEIHSGDGKERRANTYFLFVGG